MIFSRTLRLVVLCLVLVCTAGCDQVTKHFARTELAGKAPVVSRGEAVELVLAENPGMFLSLGANWPMSVRRILAAGMGLGLILVLGYLLNTPTLRWLSFLGLAFISAGGLSNLIDRFVRHGLVTDFVVVKLGPFHTGIFNVADFAIVVGAGLLVLAAFRNEKGGRVEESAIES